MGDDDLIARLEEHANCGDDGAAPYNVDEELLREAIAEIKRLRALLVIEPVSP